MPVIPDNITRLTHCTFTCHDYAAMKRFYGEVLGLKEIFNLPYTEEGLQGFVRGGFESTSKPGDEWLSYFKVSEKEFIELFSIHYVGENETQNTGFHHVCLEVEDIEEAAKELADKGYTLYNGPSYEGKPYSNGYQKELDAAGNYSFFVQDPEGNEIELAEYPAGSPSAQ